jgi:hypothetical protein
VKPVKDRRLSTSPVPVRFGSTTLFCAVFPDVHTPYDFYKKFIR